MVKRRLTISKSEFSSGYIIKCGGRGIARAKTLKGAKKKRNELRGSHRCTRMK